MKNQTLKYRNFEGSIEASLEDGCLYGRILFIQDRVIYEGETVSGLEKCFRESVDDYLETCEEVGKDPDRPCSGQFQVRIPPDMHRDAVRSAYRASISLNHFVQRSIEEKLERQEIVHHVHEHKHTLVFSEEQAFDFDTAEETSLWSQSLAANSSH